MAHSKRKSAADGDRQRTLGNPQRALSLPQQRDDVKRCFIDVYGLGRRGIFPWDPELEVAVIGAFDDATVWRSRTTVFVYFVKRPESWTW